MIKNQQAVMWIVTIGLLLIVAGTVMPILCVATDAWKYIYGSGALILIIGRLLTPAPAGVSLRVKRLCRLETWSALLFCVATFFMFYPGAGNSDWLAFTLAGGVIQAYTSIMIPRAMRRENS